MGQQREEVLTNLRRQIAHGYYVPGRLSEAEIMKDLGVSRAPVREALAVLAQEGVIEQHHRKGISVRLMGEPETREVLELRRSLEQLVVRRLASSTEPAKLHGVDEVLDEMDRAAETKDTARFLDADTEFHCGLARKAGYSAAADMLRTLKDKVRIVGLDSFDRYLDLPRANNEHRALVEAIQNSDQAAAERLLIGHLHGTNRLLLRNESSVNVASEVAEIAALVQRASDYRRHEGRVRESIELLEQAAELAREAPELDHYLVQVLLELPATRRSLRDFRAAEKHAQEALDISLASQNRTGRAWANSELGRIAVEARRGNSGLLVTASDLFTDLSGKKEDTQRGWNHYGLALRALADGDLVEARAQASSALEVLSRVDDDYGRGKALELLGRLAAQQHDLIEAKERLTEARELAAHTGYRPLLASTTLEEGRILRMGGADQIAVEEKFKSAFELFRSMQDGRGMSEALQELHDTSGRHPVE